MAVTVGELLSMDANFWGSAAYKGERLLMPHRRAVPHP